MDETRAFVSLVNEETARLEWFEAFIRRRVELEQHLASGLRALLERAPPILDSKILWHRALEKFLDGTRAELHARIEELERLKDQLQAMGVSIADTIANAGLCTRDLNSEFENLEATEGVDSAQGTTVTLHKDWLDIKSVDTSAQKGLSHLFRLSQPSKVKLENQRMLKVREAKEAFMKYHTQDLTYRRIVHQKRQRQKQFLNSIPDRVQAYGTKYWIAVRDVGMMMESFADCLRNVSSTCSSFGSAIWASAKNIKPLVDANCHTEAIEFAYHQSPIRFSPIHYRNPESKSRSPRGQTILFGCPLELCTVGELKKVPRVLEYLLDSVTDWPTQDYYYFTVDEYWPLVNVLEQAWTGVEETDRAIISKLASRSDHWLLIMGYFMALPKPVWSGDDINVARQVVRDPSSQIWNIWNKDPTKIAVLRAIVSCQVRLGHGNHFGSDMVQFLAQEWIDYSLDRIFMSLSKYPDFWGSPVSNVAEENHEAS